LAPQKGELSWLGEWGFRGCGTEERDRLRRAYPCGLEGLVAGPDHAGTEAILVAVQIDDDAMDLRQISHEIGPRHLDLAFVQAPQKTAIRFMLGDQRDRRDPRSDSTFQTIFP
jgi:hypothetical protein